MSTPFSSFLGCASISFAVLAGLSFTSLAAFPLLFAFATTGWDALLIFLLVAGAPFGGFVFLLIFTRPDSWIQEAAGLAGLWVGAFTGSVAGLKLAGVT